MELHLSDCLHLLNLGHATDGIYTINPAETGPFKVWCDMTQDGGGWTVFQRRVDAATNFVRKWDDYVVGFGDLDGNLWAGLDNLHTMTSPYDVEHHVYMLPCVHPGPPVSILCVLSVIICVFQNEACK